jgi:hypothetical protein
MTTENRLTMTGDSFGRNVKEVLHLYFEPLQWLRRGALRVVAEITDGLFPTKSLASSDASAATVPSEDMVGAGQSAVEESTTPQVVAEESAAPQKVQEWPQAVEQLSALDAVRQYMHKSTEMENEIAAVLTRIDQDFRIQADVLREVVSTLDQKLSTISARQEMNLLGGQGDPPGLSAEIRTDLEQIMTLMSSGMSVAILKVYVDNLRMKYDLKHQTVTPSGVGLARERRLIQEVVQRALKKTLRGDISKEREVLADVQRELKKLSEQQGKVESK